MRNERNREPLRLCPACGGIAGWDSHWGGWRCGACGHVLAEEEKGEVMERSTYFDRGKWRLKAGDTEFSGVWVDRLAAYEDTKEQAERDALELLEYHAIGNIDHLRELVQAEKDGRVVVLHRTPDINTLRALTVAANSLRLNCQIDIEEILAYDDALISLRDELGKAHEEAEAALAAQKGGKAE